MRIASYGRVSTPKQDAGPQLERTREWAGRGGHEIFMERVDVASGRLVRRPGQEEIMQAARGHHIHAVVVPKVDRWARSVKHLASTVEELHALGVDFYAIDQGLAVRKGDPTSQLILNVLGAVAQWEASIISERTKDGLVDKMGKGRHKKGCGVLFSCPSGKHGEKGMQAARGENPPSEGGSANDRLFAVESGQKIVPADFDPARRTESPVRGQAPTDGGSA